MNEYRQDARKRKRRKRLVKSIALLVLLVVLLVGSYGVYAFYNVYKAASESYKPIDRGSHSKLRDADVTIGKNPISILLMGVEDYSSEGKNGRTDTLIVITLNPETKKMTMLSIPRDSRVPIASEHNRKDKINAAYAYGSANGYGGTKATIDTVENFLNIPIDYYVKVGFKGFRDVIDEIGGVDVNVPFDFYDYDIFHHNKRVNFHKGQMHLNGDKALAYVRMRKQDPSGDFGRNERQRQVIEAAIDKTKSANIIFKVDDISNIIGENVATNLKPSEIYGLERVYSSIDSSNITTLKLDKGKGERIQVGDSNPWFYIPDETNVANISNELRNQLGLSDNNNNRSNNEKGQ